MSENWSTWCRSLLLKLYKSTCYLGILGLEGLLIAYWLEPSTKGQPPERGQRLCSQSVLYSEVQLYRGLHGGSAGYKNA